MHINEEPSTALPPNGSAPRMVRIMSLDDEVIDQMVCKRIIKRSGLAVDLVSFTTPADALAYFDTATSAVIDLILLDVNMPNMNGFEFLQAAQTRLSADQMPAVLVMLTVPLSTQHRLQAEKLSMIKGYLEKPFTQPKLEQALALIQSGQELSPPFV